MSESNFNLTQTGEQVQQILDNAQTSIPEAVANLQTAVTSLVSSLSAETTAREAAITAVNEAVTALQTALDTETSNRQSADTSLQSSIDSETTARQEAVTALNNAVTALQTALATETSNRQSADTSLQSNIESEASTRQSAITALSNTVSALQTALNSEVSTRESAVSTLSSAVSALQSALNSEVSTRQTADTSMQTAINNEVTARTEADAAINVILSALKKGTGVSTSIETEALSISESGVAINYTTAAKETKAGYGISNTLGFVKGRIYLIPITSQPDTNVAFLARKSTRSYDKGIIYTYTYQTINDKEVIRTATADYDSTLVYTYSYDAEGNLIAILDKNSQVVSALPLTHAVTEDFYTPLANVSVMPEENQFLFVAAQDMDVVVCNRTGQLTGNVEIMDLGLVFNMAYSFLGQSDSEVISEAFAKAFAMIASLEVRFGNLGDAKARNIDIENMPKVVDTDIISVGDDEPDVPQFAGQIYIKSDGVIYLAKSVTNSASDWLSFNFTTAVTNIASLQSNVSSLTSALATEITERASADNTLDAKITAEKNARTSADTTLQSNIDSEATTRGNADTTLQNNINSEATTRGNADTTLQNNINSEATTRESDDLVLTEGEAYLLAKITALEKLIDNLGDLKARNISTDNMPKVCGDELVILSTGAPSVTPMFVGQFYIDKDAPALYCAKAVTNSTGDWFQV